MKNIALICGGQSPEHEISVRSAKNILKAIDRNKFNVQVIGIDRNGVWRKLEEQELDKEITGGGKEIAIVPGAKTGQFILLENGSALPKPDIAYLVLHGPLGEDGTIQGFMRLLDLPFIGPDVFGSSAAMDKDFAKRLLAEAGINVANGKVFNHTQRSQIDYDEISKELGQTLFIKPANMGSSVGVHKVENKEEFDAGIEDAFLYDRKILIEQLLVGREVECAVMGNENPEASTVGEVVISEEYSYEAKYISQTAAKIQIPAKVSEEELENLKSIARRAYLAVGCEVLSRVDMFLTPTGKIYVNEINTLPGFTSISMYPKLWEASGISYSDLIEKLIGFALERHALQTNLKTVM